MSTLAAAPPPVGAAVSVETGAERARTPPFLAVEGIVKTYGRQRVLDDVSLALDGDEFVCLLGPSGCGKTTLLRILCGIEDADAGRIRLRGDDIAALPPATRRFGVVFQSYALFPNLTAEQNVGYGLHGLPRAQRRQRCREMLALVGLADHATKYPAQLSGGQQQRVALARALAPQPQLLLLDEPLSALDAKVRATLRDELRRLQQRLRVPTVMVTHDQDEALAIADRVVLMHAGRVEQSGAPLALYRRPASRFVAGFVGRMNLWPIDAVDDGAVRIGSLHLPLPASAPVPRSGNWLAGLRPESVTLRERAATAQPHEVEAVVDEVVFCGAHVVLRLRCDALPGPLEVVRPTPSSDRLPWRVGDRLWAGLPAQALVVMAAERS